MKSRDLKVIIGVAMSTLMMSPTAMSDVAAVTERLDVRAETNKYEVKVPIVMQQYLPCTGEVVTVEGPFHILWHAAVNGSRLNLQEQYNPMGMIGSGASSGDTYRATGVEHLFTTFSVEGFPVNLGRVLRFHFVGTGTAASFFVKQTQHLTIGANGEVTSSVDSFDLTCE